MDDGLMTDAQSRLFKNSNTVRQGPDHFGTYRNFFDAEIHVRRLSNLLAFFSCTSSILHLSTDSSRGSLEGQKDKVRSTGSCNAPSSV